MASVTFEETRKAMKETVLNAENLSQEDFLDMLENHEKFLSSGGAGGRWETFYIDHLTFGVYKDAEGEQGKQAHLSFRDLSALHLEGISMPYGNCAAILCVGKNWEGSDLEGCLLIDSILNDCNFQNADLYAADFSRSEMRNCDFRGASLIKADFENCDLTGADFRGAQIDDSTSFKNAMMDNVLRD
jgi:uncharacterized protein YjbI with pentapeptide repeats